MKQKFNTKRERFTSLAVSRTNKVLKSIKVLGHCNNRLMYEFKLREIDKIFNAIQKELDETKLSFKIRKGVKFSFNENL